MTDATPTLPLPEFGAPADARAATDGSRRAAATLAAQAESIAADIRALTDDNEVVRDTFEGEFDTNAAVDFVLKFMADDEAMIAAIDAQIAQMQKRKQRLKARELASRDLLRRILVASVQDSIERPLATVSLRKVNAALDSDLEEAIVPAQYWHQPDPVLKRDAILADLKAGVAVPGARLAPERKVVEIRRG